MQTYVRGLLTCFDISADKLKKEYQSLKIQVNNKILTLIYHILVQKHYIIIIDI